MIIKKIFSGDFDWEVHNELLKFGRGEFKDKYLIEVKKQASVWNIKTSSEFANFFVKKCLTGAGRIHIKGVIITTMNLGGGEELGFEIKKRSNFQGIKKIEIDSEIESEKILNLMEKYPRIFFALSFKTNDCGLKIKVKAPKSVKPGKGNETRADFCSLKTSNSEIVKELLFDIKNDFKEVRISHIIKVEDIIYPKDIRSMKPEEVREMSKRKGVVIRKVEIDGRKEESKAGFEV